MGSSTAVRIPIYGCITKIPASYGGRQGQEPAAAVPYAVEADSYTMSMDSAFWVYNLVANLAYGERYADVYPLVQAEINKYQGRFFEETAALDATLLKMYETDPASAVQAATDYCVMTGDKMVVDWRNFWMYLFSRVRDGFTTIPGKITAICKRGQTKNCVSKATPQCQTTGYTKSWYARMIADPANAKHYAVPDSGDTALHSHKMLRMEKLRAQ